MYHYKRDYKDLQRKFALLMCGLAMAATLAVAYAVSKEPDVVAPIPESEIVKPSKTPTPSPSKAPSPTVTPTKAQEVSSKTFVATRAAQVAQPTTSPAASTSWSGTASYYSRAGCLGCNWRMGHSGWNLYNNDGSVLDDTALTVAFNRLPLGSLVKVKNLANGLEVVAKVTDTGGFERHGRIIDITIATRDAIGCTNLCQVEVTAQ